MTDHPIIFSAPMVRALLGGNKTMTRRLAWAKPIRSYRLGGRCCCTSPLLYENPTPWQKVQPGGRLYVREAFAIAAVGENPCQVLHRASTAGPYRGRWKPSIHMPRWASRLTLNVTAVKVERLQAISEADAEAEGSQIWPLEACEHPDFSDSFCKDFRAIWERLYGPDAWDANPEVCAISFRCIKKNIDSLEGGK